MIEMVLKSVLAVYFVIFILLGFLYPGWWVIAFVLASLYGWQVVASILARIVTNSEHYSYAKERRTSLYSSTLPPKVPDDIYNLLIDISSGEIKDPVTQEIFHPGEKVFLCLVHRLAYHEDSWMEMGSQYMVCGNKVHTRTYILPVPIDNQMDVSHLIDFRDIE